MSTRTSSISSWLGRFIVKLSPALSTLAEDPRNHCLEAATLLKAAAKVFMEDQFTEGDFSYLNFVIARAFDFATQTDDAGACVAWF